MTVKPETLELAWNECRVAWPAFTVSEELFAEHVQRLGLDDQQASMYGRDLILVLAVRNGDPGALAVFDQLVVTASRISVRIDSAPSFADEVRQELRVKLLTGQNPKLSKYTASGALLDWMRVVALRVAINLKRPERHTVLDERPIAKSLVPTEDPLIHLHYGKDLNGALEACFRELATRDRTLLRLHFVEGLSIDRVAVMYGVHRATLTRWLASIRERLFDAVAARLARTHGLAAADVKSIYRRLQGDLHITLSRVLQSQC